MKTDVLHIDPQPRFDLSPYLYMQFMEPLGTTDSSVEAAWDFQRQEWRQDVVQVTRDLGPTLIRWGGCLSSYYLWQEGVGPRDQRRPMPNLLWGGIESNQVGTHEFVSFCRQVGAEPLLSVNFESDGRQRWAIRSAGPADAAAWVDYCNNPRNTERRAHGHPEPYDVRLWQIGNETSYDPDGFDGETAARKTIAFAEAMREADPEIALIGWGDSGWAKRMLEVAGEHLQYLAFHNMFRAGSDQEDSPLQGTAYRRDWDETWEHLMNAFRGPESKLQRVREETAGTDVPLAITECHFALPGRNRCEVLSTWAAGVANARILNVHERN
ncbi:MAG: alpha-L-arabinofuranosidase, partial [Anaerolineae bacterium]